uniref:Uncharacterized protein n=1 Tax=Mastacembelus armatus TaxID=205130 RepID=A0A3Q3LAU5_9TELE
MAKDHGLSNELLDCVQRLLFTLQPYDIGFRNHLLCKSPHRLLKGCREKEHLTVLCVPLDANALVSMTLCSDHHISLIQYKHCNFLGVNEFVLGAPVKDCTWCSNDNLLLNSNYGQVLTSVASNAICQFHIWTKFPHLLNYLTNLQSQLICRRNAQTLKEPILKTESPF